MTDHALAFTETAVRAARHYGTGPSCEYRFKNIDGLVLVVMRPGQDRKSSRTWRCRYSVTLNGERHKRNKKLGRFPSMNLASARAAASALMEQVEAGKDPVGEALAAKDRERQDVLTFADLVADYVADRRARGATSIGELERALKRDAIPALGKMRPKDITPRDVQSCVDSLCERMAKARVERLKREKKPVTKEDEDRRDFAMARHVRRYIGQAFNFALLDDVDLVEKYSLTSNPAAAVGRNRRGAVGRYGKDVARDRFLEDTEVKAFWRSLDSSKAEPSMVTMLRVMLLLGVRRSEARCAMIEELHLDGDAPMWVIPKHRTKNRKGHRIPLPATAVAMLRAVIGKRKKGAVFFSNETEEGFYDQKSPNQTILRLIDSGRLAIPRFSPHDFRRTIETGMTKLGVAEEVREAILNHTSQTVTKRHYNRHDFEGEIRAALEKWAQHIAKLVVD